MLTFPSLLIFPLFLTVLSLSPNLLSLPFESRTLSPSRNNNSTTVAVAAATAPAIMLLLYRCAATKGLSLLCLIVLVLATLFCVALAAADTATAAASATDVAESMPPPPLEERLRIFFLHKDTVLMSPRAGAKIAVGAADRIGSGTDAAVVARNLYGSPYRGDNNNDNTVGNANDDDDGDDDTVFTSDTDIASPRFNASGLVRRSLQSPWVTMAVALPAVLPAALAALVPAPAAVAAGVRSIAAATVESLGRKQRAATAATAAKTAAEAETETGETETQTELPRWVHWLCLVLPAPAALGLAQAVASPVGYSGTLILWSAAAWGMVGALLRYVRKKHFRTPLGASKLRGRSKTHKADATPGAVDASASDNVSPDSGAAGSGTAAAVAATAAAVAAVAEKTELERECELAQAEHDYEYNALGNSNWVEWDSYLLSTAHAAVSLAVSTPYWTLTPVWVTLTFTFKQYAAKLHEFVVSLLSSTSAATAATAVVAANSTATAAAAATAAATATALENAAVEDILFDISFGTSPSRDAALAVTAGYLLYDLVTVLLHQREFFYKHVAARSPLPRARSLLSHPGLPILTHHVVVVSTFAGGLAARQTTWFMAALVANEASTLFVNANYLMAASRHAPRLTAGRCYRANGVALLVVFFLCRVWHNSLLALQVAAVAWPALGRAAADAVGLGPVAVGAGMTLGLCVHVAVNLWWFRGILTAVRRKLLRPSAVAPAATRTVRAGASARDRDANAKSKNGLAAGAATATATEAAGALQESVSASGKPSASGAKCALSGVASHAAPAPVAATSGNAALADTACALESVASSVDDNSTRQEQEAGLRKRKPSVAAATAETAETVSSTRSASSEGSNIALSESVSG